MCDVQSPYKETMSYFGGLGAGKGWNTFNFILVPAEFESLFTDLQFYFIVHNRRVEINYEYSDHGFIFKAYQLFFEQTLIGQNELDRREKWEIEQDIRISITDDLKKIEFENIVDKKGFISEEFKLVRPTEPVINITPFYLTLTKDEKLSVAYSNEEGVIGLQLTYPKFISWKTDNFNSVQETGAFGTSRLFDNLVDRIKNITHKAKMASLSKTYKPNFWISKQAVTLMNENRYFKLNHLTLRT